MIDTKGNRPMGDYRDRFVADSADRDTWLAARSLGIGASDAASYAKLESVEKYVRAKLKSGEFTGNAYTATGNRWEEPALNGVGIVRNTFMFHARDNPLFFATPDGMFDLHDGRVANVEAKAVLVKDAARFDPETWTPKITPSHARQIAWAQYVLEAEYSLYVVLPYDERHTPLAMIPTVLRIERDDFAIDKLIQIATLVLAALQTARSLDWK